MDLADRVGVDASNGSPMRTQSSATEHLDQTTDSDCQCTVIHP